MNGRTRTVFAIVRFITDNPAERGAVEGEKAIANGFTIEGLIAAAPLRKTELSRRTDEEEKALGRRGHYIHVCARDRQFDGGEGDSGQAKPRSAASLLSFLLLPLLAPPPSKFRALFSRFWASLVFIRSIFRSNGGSDGRTDVYHFSAAAAASDD